MVKTKFLLTLTCLTLTSSFALHALQGQASGSRESKESHAQAIEARGSQVSARNSSYYAEIADILQRFRFSSPLVRLCCDYLRDIDPRPFLICGLEEPIIRYRSATNHVNCRLCADGKRLLALVDEGQDGAHKLMDITPLTSNEQASNGQPQELCQLQQYDCCNQPLQFSGNRLSDGMNVWDIETGALVVRMHHKCMSRDGTKLLINLSSRGCEVTPQVYDIATKMLTNLPGHYISSSHGVVFLKVPGLVRPYLKNTELEPTALLFHENVGYEEPYELQAYDLNNPQACVWRMNYRDELFKRGDPTNRRVQYWNGHANRSFHMMDDQCAVMTRTQYNNGQWGTGECQKISFKDQSIMPCVGEDYLYNTTAIEDCTATCLLHDRRFASHVLFKGNLYCAVSSNEYGAKAVYQIHKIDIQKILFLATLDPQYLAELGKVLDKGLKGRSMARRVNAVYNCSLDGNEWGILQQLQAHDPAMYGNVMRELQFKEHRVAQLAEQAGNAAQNNNQQVPVLAQPTLAQQAAQAVDRVLQTVRNNPEIVVGAALVIWRYRDKIMRYLRN